MLFKLFSSKQLANIAPCAKERDPQLRALLCGLHSIGRGAKKIKNLYSRLWLSTMKSTIPLQPARTNNTTHSRSNRPKKLTFDQRARILQLVDQRNLWVKDFDFCSMEQH